MCSDRTTPGRPRRRPTLRSAPTLATALAALLLVPLAGCGKQGDPAPPLRYVPQKTDRVQVQQRGYELLLEFAYPKTTTAGMALAGLERVEVLEVVRPVSAADLDLVGPDVGTEAAPDLPREIEQVTAGEEEIEDVTSEGEPREPADGSFRAEVGIVGADEVDQAKARRDVAEEMAEASAEAQEEPPGEIDPDDEDDALAEEGEAEEGETAAGTAAADEEGELSPAALERQRRNRMLRPLDDREFELASELRLTLAGDDLRSAVVGDQIQVRLPLPRPLAAEPRIHYLAVRTVSDRGDTSVLSGQARIVPLEPPPAPRGLQAEARGDGIEISWEPQGDDVVGYNLYRRNARFRTFENPVAVPPSERTSYLDRSAQVGETYIYAVTSVAQRRPLVESEVAEVREVDYRDRFAPPAPQNAVALAEEDRVRVVWQGSEASDLAGYRVSRRAGADGEFQSVTPEPLTGTEYVDRDLRSGVTYTYRVVAVDETGNESAPAEARTEAR